MTLALHNRSARTGWLLGISGLLVVLAMAGLAMLAGRSGPANAAAPDPQYIPPAGAVTVDGSDAEWNTTNDFFANMYRAGNSSKPVESRLYVRYECSTQTLFVLVLTVDGVPALEQEDDAFVKLGNSNKLVDGDSGDNGTPPDFAWVYDGQTLVGFEASAHLAPGSYSNLNVHLQVFDDGESQTSAVADRAIDLDIDCPETFEIEVCKLLYGNDDGVANEQGDFIFEVKDLDSSTVYGTRTVSFSAAQGDDDGGVTKCASEKVPVPEGARVQVIETVPNGWTMSPEDPDGGGSLTTYPWYHVDGSPSYSALSLGGGKYATRTNDGKLADDEGVTRDHTVTIKNKPADAPHTIEVNVCKWLFNNNDGDLDDGGEFTLHLVAEGALDTPIKTWTFDVDETNDEYNKVCSHDQGQDGPAEVEDGTILYVVEDLPNGWVNAPDSDGHSWPGWHTGGSTSDMDEITSLLGEWITDESREAGDTVKGTSKVFNIKNKREQTPPEYDIQVCKLLFGNRDNVANDSGVFTFRVETLDGTQIGEDIILDVSASDTGEETECETVKVPEGTKIRVIETQPEGWVNSTDDPGVGGSVTAYPWYHVDGHQPFRNILSLGDRQYATQDDDIYLAGQDGVEDDHTVTIKNKHEDEPEDFDLEVCKLMFGNGDGFDNEGGTFTFRVEDLSTTPPTILHDDIELTVDASDNGEDTECETVSVPEGTRVRVVETQPEGWVNSLDDPAGAPTMYPWYHVDGQAPFRDTVSLGDRQYATQSDDIYLAGNDGIDQGRTVTIKNKPADEIEINVCKWLYNNGDGDLDDGGTFTLHLVSADDPATPIKSWTFTIEEPAEGYTVVCSDDDGEDGPATVTEGTPLLVIEDLPDGWVNADPNGHNWPGWHTGGATLSMDAVVSALGEWITSEKRNAGDDVGGEVSFNVKNKSKEDDPQRLRVCKDVVDPQTGAPVSDWDFTITFLPGNEQETYTAEDVDAGDGERDNCSDWFEAPEGTTSVTVDEAAPSGNGSWDTEWSADNVDDDSGTGLGATVTLDEEDTDITVLFTNTRVLFDVTVCKVVVDNEALPDGEGADFPVDVDYTRNGAAGSDDPDLTQDEDNSASEEVSCETYTVDRDSTLSVDETQLGTLDDEWTFLGSKLNSDTPGGYDADNSFLIDEDGYTVYVFNTRPTHDLLVCKHIVLNPSSKLTALEQGGTFSFELVIDGVVTPVDFTLTDDASAGDETVDVNCFTITLSEGAEVTVSEDGLPLDWKDAPGYPRYSVNGGSQTAGTTTGTIAVEGEGAVVVRFYNKLPSDPETFKVPAEVAYDEATNTASWQIQVVNSGPDSIDRTVTISDPGVTLVGAAPAGCVGDIGTAAGIECPLGAESSITLTVQQVIGQSCFPGEALNDATITIDDEIPVTVTSEPIDIPADEELCDDPSIDKSSDGYSVAGGVATWTVTIDNRTGDSIARTVYILDSDVELVNGLPAGCTGDIDTGLTCELAANQVLTFQVQRAIAQECQPGVAVNTIEVRLDGPEGPHIGNSPDNATPIDIPADEDLCDLPDLSKVATGFITASNSASWRIEVSNEEPGAIDRTVTITDPGTTLATVIPFGACDTANTSLETGLECEVAAGTVLQLFVLRGPIGLTCEPQVVTNTASATLDTGEPLDGSPTGSPSVNVPVLDSLLCDEIETPSETPTEGETPSETPTADETPSPTEETPMETETEEPGETPSETPTGEPTIVLPTVVEPTPSETETDTETEEPTETSTEDPTAVAPTVVVPTPPDSGTGLFRGDGGGNSPPWFGLALGVILLAGGAVVLANIRRPRV